MREALRGATALAMLLGGLAAGSPATASGLDALLGRDTPALLPVEQAFAVRLARSNGTPVLYWDIAPGYYLYRDQLRLEAVPPPALGSTPIAVKVLAALPAGEVMDDESFGRVAVFRGQVRVPLAVEPPDAALAGLRVHYQGCAEGRACYSPAVRVINLENP